MVKQVLVALEVAMTVIMLVAFLPSTTDATQFFIDDIPNRFEGMVDKTALPTTGELNPIHREFTMEDIMLMLVMTDNYCPEPKKIVIELPGQVKTTIDFNTDFYVNRLDELADAFGSYTSNEDIEINRVTTTSGDSYWHITARN